MQRRHFIKTLGLGSSLLVMGFRSKAAVPIMKQPKPNPSSSPYRPKILADGTYLTRRPSTAERKFTSQAVEECITQIKAEIADKELAWMFENCFPNTLDTTVSYSERNGKPATYVITGDIDAMWLRDSSAQVWPDLPLAKHDPALKKLLKGVVVKQTEFVLLDPYANAFYDDPSHLSEWNDDKTVMKPGIHERKWEIDSLCYVIRLAYGYWKNTADLTAFDEDWQKAMKLIVKTFKEQQRLTDKGPYRFQRTAANPTDTQFGGGYGNPTKKNGLIHSMFRPSDDATFYPFLVSSNWFAVVSLRQLAEIFGEAINDAPMAASCLSFANELEQVLRKVGLAHHPVAGEIIPLETDGFGNTLLMDDANVPNLLSLPYLGAIKTDDPLYQNTRAFSLSPYNPWFHEGQFASGIGGPHVGEMKIWPMGLIMQALTSTKDDEILYCLSTLKKTHAGTGYIHESFHVDDPNDFSRSWFAWANTLFGELIVQLYREKPELLKRSLHP